MYLDLNEKQVQQLIPLVEARIKTLKNRVLKKYGDEWYDYPMESIDYKVDEKCDEHSRLRKLLHKLYRAN